LLHTFEETLHIDWEWQSVAALQAVLREAFLAPVNPVLQATHLAQRD
jgi:hypothetical protein